MVQVLNTIIHSAGDMELSVAHKLYNRGLVYLDVPISDDDCITMPPLEG